MPNEAPSLQDTVTAAVEAATTADAPVVEAPEQAALPLETVPEGEAPAKPERTRAEDGTFKPAPKEAKKPGAPVKPSVALAKGPEKAVAAPGETKAGGEVAPPAPPPAEVKPVRVPQSWKAPIKELAAKLPEEFRPLLDEALRVEGESVRKIAESAQAKQFASEVHRSLAPYAGIAQANGMQPMDWAGQALQTVAALYAGTPQQKAQVIAKAISLSGVDTNAVNAILEGQAPQGAAPAAPQQDVGAIVQRVLDERLGAITSTRADQSVREWGGKSPEFMELDTPFDQRSDGAQRRLQTMQGLLGANPKLTLDQAHAMVLRADEETAPILDQRKAADAAKAQASTLAKAKAAGSSLKPAPAESAAPGRKGTRSLEDTVRDAVAASQRIT